MERGILVVEDEPDVRTSLQDLLRTLPACRVDVAPNYAEGLLRARSRTWDLIIADHRLRDGSGLDILADIAQTSPVTRLVLMSAFQDFEVAIAAINDARIDHFVQKPWDPEALLAQVTQLLQQANPRGRELMRQRSFRRL